MEEFKKLLDMTISQKPTSSSHETFEIWINKKYAVYAIKMNWEYRGFKLRVP